MHVCFLCRRSGADKVSIGSDAVDAAEEYYAAGCVTNGSTAIEQISEVYGKQAVVVSSALFKACLLPLLSADAADDSAVYSLPHPCIFLLH
jgi:hypothetical protein